MKKYFLLVLSFVVMMVNTQAQTEEFKLKEQIVEGMQGHGRMIDGNKQINGKTIFEWAKIAVKSPKYCLNQFSISKKKEIRFLVDDLGNLGGGFSLYKKDNAWNSKSILFSVDQMLELQGILNETYHTGLAGSLDQLLIGMQYQRGSVSIDAEYADGLITSYGKIQEFKTLLSIIRNSIIDWDDNEGYIYVDTGDFIFHILLDENGNIKEGVTLTMRVGKTYEHPNIYFPILEVLELQTAINYAVK